MNDRFRSVGYVTAALLAAASMSVGAATPQAGSALRGADEYIERARRDWDIPGMSVAVVQGERVIYARGFGVREFDSSEPVDRDTLFEIGSTSKAFTAAAIGMLVDDGKLKWDDAVTAHMPQFRLHDPWLTQNLTVRDALTHRSGLIDPEYYVVSIIDMPTVLQRMRYIKTYAPFRASYEYSNLMYAVASQVIEAAAGMRWDEFMDSRLLKPLKMTRSGTSAYQFWDARHVAPTFFGSAPAGKVSYRDARVANVAMPHTRGEDGQIRVIPWQTFDNAPGAGSIVSSASDMGNWLICQLNEGRFEGRQIIGKTTLQETHRQQNPLDEHSHVPFDAQLGFYAMGWVGDRYHGETHLSHGGGIAGFPAYVAMLPEHKLGVVVLANGRGKGVDVVPYTLHRSIALWIFDRLQGVEPAKDWSAEFLRQDRIAEQKSQAAESELQKSRLPHAAPALPLEHYAGEYEEPLFGRVKVGIENGALVLRFPGDGAFSGRLEYWHAEVFRLHWNDGRANRSFVTFSIDPSGKVALLRLFGNEFRRL